MKRSVPNSQLNLPMFGLKFNGEIYSRDGKAYINARASGTFVLPHKDMASRYVGINIDKEVMSRRKTVRYSNSSDRP